MDEKIFSKEEFMAMDAKTRNNVLMRKPKIKGKGVVRRADGSIKYDDVSLKGTYDEGEVE